MARLIMNENGWTCLQEANVEKHIMAVNCRAENGMVVEVRIRHSRGEEQIAKVTINGENALPMEVNEFKKNFDKDKLDIE